MDKSSLLNRELVQVQFCDLCHSDSHLTELMVHGWCLVKCCECGLVFTNPRYSDQALERLYSEQYYETAKEYFSSQVQQPSADHFSLARQVKRLFGHRQSLRSLDIGCGSGQLVKAFGRMGFEAVGLEPSAKAAQWAQSIGLDVRQTPLEEMPAEYYDVVTALHVLEHVRQPSLFIKECSRILRFKGIFVLETPNYGSLRAIRMREQWQPLYPDTHLYQFTPVTLRKMIEMAGLQIASERRLGGSSDWGHHDEKNTNPSAPAVAPRTQRSLFRHLKKVIWDSRRLIFKVPFMHQFIRYIYWHLMGNGEYIQIIAKKPNQLKISDLPHC